MGEKQCSFRKCLVWFSILFLLLMGAVGFWFAKDHVTFVVSGDGTKQHYKALIYYGRYLRNVLKTVFVDHSLRIPTWDFTIGEGSDIFQALQYYVIGDPFAALAVFVPDRFMYVFYHVVIILRLWCAGVAFMALCFYQKKKEFFSVLAGALTYAFCYWALRNICRHPYFLNPMVYLPLIVLGLEKIFKGERPYVYVLAIWVSALSNFYFFYGIVLTTVIYVAVRLVVLYYKDVRTGAFRLLQIALYSVLATAMAAVLFIPICRIFLVDSRMGVGYTLLWHYRRSYYFELPSLFLGMGNRSWLCMGFAAPALPAAFLLWLRPKKHISLNIFFAICVIICMIPALGQIFNGFSYVANRWCWSFALLVSYLVTLEWQEMLKAKRWEKAVLLALCVVWLLFCGKTQGFTPPILWGPALAALFVLIAWGDWGKVQEFRRQLCLLGLTVVICIVGNGVWEFSAFGEHRTEHMVSVDELLEILDSRDIRAVKQASEGDEDLFRFSGNNMQINTNMLGGLSNTQYYWTVSNPNTFLFRRDLELIENITYNYRHYDDRAALETLAAVKYHIARDEGGIPYGFTRISTPESEEDTSYQVYRNEFALPLCYTYDKMIAREDWEAMDALSRQEALLQGILVEDYDGEGEIIEPETSWVPREYNMEIVENVTPVEGGLKVEGDSGKIKLRYEGMPGCETFVSFKGLTLKSKKVDQIANIVVNSARNVRKTLTYYQPEFRLYCDRHDFLVNLGYNETSMNSLSITLPGPGTYSYSDLSVFCLPMDHYEERVQALGADKVEDMSFGVNSFSARAEVDAPKWLCLAIPCSDGWTAEVDGEKATLYRANQMYMALRLQPGSHEIRLQYRTPLFRLGILVSLLAAAVFLAVILRRERKERRKK